MPNSLIAPEAVRPYPQRESSHFDLGVKPRDREFAVTVHDFAATDRAARAASTKNNSARSVADTLALWHARITVEEEYGGWGWHLGICIAGRKSHGRRAGSAAMARI